ncbi:HesB-like selenoprotein [Proteiniclasticum ruminis]|uniref:HesB-like selenoprotein n=2 Tax=Proteiniclasticum ruminis TaxID=398199 RepID=A0A1G8H8C5_9CLOT|nr:HesB-like protein [Proteiniclasticum ruminis]SDI02750.1 HesB-like selenoprotein [Proteiniclasticum ruminis]
MINTMTNMIEISDAGYQEFNDLLEANDIEPKVVRLALAGFGCSGPRFGLMVDEATDSDVVEVIKDITFIVAKDLYDEYQGFVILSDEENYGGGMSLRPKKIDENIGCSTCATGCAV